jgi:hypothetical protein
MGFKEFLDTLASEGIHLEEHNIRYAIKRRRISRPVLDPSLRFLFEKKHLEEARKLHGKLRANVSATATATATKAETGRAK